MLIAWKSACHIADRRQANVNPVAYLSALTDEPFYAAVLLTFT
jgi:hypothetical protein